MAGRQANHAVRWAFLVFAASVLASVISACAATPAPGDGAEQTSEPPIGGATAFVVDRGWHTDIALPAEAIAGTVPALGQAFPGVRFLVFGFGDHAYYMSHDETFLGMLKALFPGPGVILITALRAPPDEAFGADHVVTLSLSPAGFARIATFIRDALGQPTDGSILSLGDGPYPGSVFYASRGIYDAFHNCNHWTLAALRSGGLPVNPAGVMSAGQVMEQVRQIAGRQQNRDTRSPSP